VTRVVVTGGAGRVGRAVVRDLVDHGLELRGPLGEFETLLSVAKARRLFGYEPAFSWRDAIGRST
jgi:uncharacterized protein YbjT (DUF2867 family)